MARVERVLIIDYLDDLPVGYQLHVRTFASFGNDRMLEYISEMGPSDGQTWADSLVMKEIESYWHHQCESAFVGTLEQFITDYGLSFDVWIMNQGFNLDVTKILIDICW